MGFLLGLQVCNVNDLVYPPITRIILDIGPGNQRRRYSVASITGSAYTQNDPCYHTLDQCYTDVTELPWRPKSPAKRLFIEQCIQADDSEKKDGSALPALLAPNLQSVYLCGFQNHMYYSVSGYLTHWGRVTHICVGNLTIIGTDNGLSPGRRQAIIWTNAGILLIRTLGKNFSEILGKIHSFSFEKMHLKMSSAKGRLFSLGLNELKLMV